MFGILRQHNPELTGEKRRTIMKPPQVRNIGCAFLADFDFDRDPDPDPDDASCTPVACSTRVCRKRPEHALLCLPQCQSADMLGRLPRGVAIGTCTAAFVPPDVATVCVQVAREGTKKTVFTNFPELCRSMNRGQEHVMAFLLAELGTRYSLLCSL